MCLRSCQNDPIHAGGRERDGVTDRDRADTPDGPIKHRGREIITAGIPGGSELGRVVIQTEDDRLPCAAQ